MVEREKKHDDLQHSMCQQNHFKTQSSLNWSFQMDVRMAVIWSKCLINVQFMFDDLQGFFSWWLTTGEQEGSGLYSNIIFLLRVNGQYFPDWIEF